MNHNLFLHQALPLSANRLQPLNKPIMSTDKIEPDYDAVPFPSNSSRSRPSLHDMYQNYKRGPVPATYPVFHMPVYDDLTGSSHGGRRAASPHTLVAPGSTVYSRYPGPQQDTARLNATGGVGRAVTNPPGRYIPWNDDRREDLEKDSEKDVQLKDPVQEEKERLTGAEVEYERLQAMSTKEREKYLRTKRIEFHVTCGYYLKSTLPVLMLIDEVNSNLQSPQLPPSPRASSSYIWRAFPSY